MLMHLHEDKACVEFAQEMTHPRYGVAKLYTVIVRGRLEDSHLDKARGGVWLAEGPTGGMQLKVDRMTKDRTFLKVTLREGKNREIRRVFAKLGYPVASLKRVRIGSLTLHGLGDGDWRFLQLGEPSNTLLPLQRPHHTLIAHNGKKLHEAGRPHGVFVFCGVCEV